MSEKQRIQDKAKKRQQKRRNERKQKQCALAMEDAWYNGTHADIYGD